MVARGSIIYVGSSDFAFFSSNSGATWRQIRSGLGQTNSVCEGLYLSGNRVFYGSNLGVGFRANFGDTTWTRMFETGGLHNVKAFFNHNDTLYAGYDIGMQRSFDNGTTWNLAPTAGLTSTAARDVYAFTRRGTTLYIGTNQGVYASGNSGSSWSAVSGLPTDDDDVRALATVGNSVIVGMRFRGVWRSTDGVNLPIQPFGFVACSKDTSSSASGLQERLTKPLLQFRRPAACYGGVTLSGVEVRCRRSTRPCAALSCSQSPV